MATLEEIESLIKPILDSKNVELSELAFRKEDGMKILQIAIMYADGSMDIETCEVVSTLISDVLDKQDVVSGEYFLEVCSAGAERPLKTDSHIKGSIDKYIYVSFTETISNMNDVYGYLKEVDDTELLIEYLDKTRKTKLLVDRSKIKSIRLAIKI